MKDTYMVYRTEVGRNVMRSDKYGNSLTEASFPAGSVTGKPSMT